ncbi:hypothetical protein A2Z41_01900 [Microgenomates group bacterium RBG_19FT_COMBO_39_10]|nr:MAG: hypothetical protein A2Z41_01900 [Microgenomates group bacterium RBG_19FT_COMBO_39_10]
MNLEKLTAIIKKDKIIAMFKKIFRSRKKTAVVAIILLLAIIVSWRVLANGEKQPQLQTAEVQKGTIISSISTAGTVLTANTFSVTTSATGVVKGVYVSEGAIVIKGQKIAEIDLDTEGNQAHVSAYASYISAVNSLKSAENSYRSAQVTLEKTYDEIKGHDEDETFTMKETRTKAEVANDNAYDAIQTSKAKLSSAALDYQSSSPVIVAPAPGVITSITIAEGMNFGSQDTTSDTRASLRIATIESEGTPLASFNLSEIDILQVKTGQKATITLDSLAGKTFTGKVVSVDRIGNVTSGVTTYPIIIQFDISSEQILPNMTATAEIITEIKENVLWVPSQAIKTQAGQAIVKVLVNGEEQEREVEVGLENSDQAEIISGLNEGETVITSETVTGEETSFSSSGLRGIMPGGGFEVKR